jgi:hypothetical protein
MTQPPNKDPMIELEVDVSSPLMKVSEKKKGPIKAETENKKEDEE